MVVSHVGGLIFSVCVCVMMKRGLGFREVVALQVPENHLDLETRASLNFYLLVQKF